MSKHLSELNDIKKRLNTDLKEGQEILQRLEPLLASQQPTSTSLYANNLRNAIQQQEDLLEPLQKELPESLKAANFLLETMDESQQAFKVVLAGLSYHYGSDAPELLEFVSPPNSFGYGREPESRRRAHQRAAEAFQRRQADFEKGSRLRRDLEHLLQQGQHLEQAHLSYLKESSESNAVLQQALNALAEYRKQKSLLRRALMLELPNPSDVYNYIPKRNTKPSTKTNPSENPTPTES